MHYIVYDLEFNQDFSPAGEQKVRGFGFEIIQIGAVKLDDRLNTVDRFQRNVKPTIYPSINPFITELTGITTEQLVSEETFPSVYQTFAEFTGGSESVFCIWGMADIKELFRNIEYHGLDSKIISKRYLNLQPYTAQHFNLSRKKMMKLKTAAELLGIPLVYSFHNALHDAFYTAEIMKRINKPDMKPKRYDPEQASTRRRTAQSEPERRKVDFEKLVRQFEKMYGKELTQEEKAMVILAYQMGKTRQFLK